MGDESDEVYTNYTAHLDMDQKLFHLAGPEGAAVLKLPKSFQDPANEKRTAVEGHLSAALEVVGGRVGPLQVEEIKQTTIFEQRR